MLTLGDDSTIPSFGYSEKSAVCVVLSAEGYPQSVRKGDIISGVDEFDKDKNIVIFHAGTKRTDNGLETAGGRVLCVTATGDNIEKARDSVYQAIQKINFRGMHYRTDIALN